MKKKTRKESGDEGIADTILGKLDQIIPGFHGFLKKAGGSKIFGAKIGEIRKEIERRFGGVKR